MSNVQDSEDEPIEDEYGTAEKHVGECGTCGREIVRDGTSRGFERLDDELATHIDDGTACHGYRIERVYQDGGGRRVA